MIVRISALLVLRSQSDEFLESLCQQVLSAPDGAEGFRFVLLLKRNFVAYTEATLLSMWDSEEEMNRFFNEHRSRFTPEEGIVIEKDPCIYTVVMGNQKVSTGSQQAFYPQGAD